MIVKFRLNPVVIKKDNKPVGIIQCELPGNYEFPLYVELFNKEKNKPLKLKDLKGNSIYSSKFDQNTFLSIDESVEEAILIFKNANGSVLTEQYIKTKDNKKVSNVKQDLYEELEQLVKDDMDNPKGTKEEKNNHTAMLKVATYDKKAKNYVLSKIRQVVVKSELVQSQDIEDIIYKLYGNLYGMGVLQELDDDIEVGEIMVNATTYPKFHSDIYYIKNGVKYKYDKQFKDLDELKKVFNRTIEFDNKEINSVENSIIEATRENKDRINIIVPDASDNYILNIRKFSNFIPNLATMKQSGTVDNFLDKLFDIVVRGKANIGIGGEMGTGKTTLINYLLTYTKPIERKVVIASVSETDIDRVLKGHDVVILNVNDEKKISFAKLMKASLRTTASRVIVPESRGEEFKQIYEANLKTKGNMFTAHALDDESFLDMCVDMYKSTSNDDGRYVKDKLSKSINIIVIMKKIGNKIRIKSVSEIIIEDGKYKKMNPLYEWIIDPENPLEGHYERTENRLSPELKKIFNENGVPMSEMEDL